MIDFGFGVTLGPLDSDYQDKIRTWRNDRRIWNSCRQFDVISDQEQERWFDRQSLDDSTRMYAILGEGEHLFGVCGLTSIDRQNRRAEFSLYIDPERQRAGLGSSTLRTLL